MPSNPIPAWGQFASLVQQAAAREGKGSMLLPNPQPKGVTQRNPISAMSVTIPWTLRRRPAACLGEPHVRGMHDAY